MTEPAQSQKGSLADAGTGAAVAAGTFATPERFGKYWLDAQLAEGGMSRVMRARLRGPGGFEKKLVVKQILPRLAQDPGFIELFVREANTLVQMSHPNIVPVYELGVVDGVYFLAMELVDGATVAELLADGALPHAMCAHIAAQVCEALCYAHERFQVVHRDVTPRNIIIDASGHARLLDFGIAAPFALAADGELFGSPGYMSPEQMRGQALGPESDLFSLGSVLYEMLSGKRAFPVREGALLRDARPARLSDGDGVDSELAALVNQLLAIEPGERPSSAAQVGARFRTWLAQKHPEGVAAALGRRAELARERTRTGAEPPVRLAASALSESEEPHEETGVTRSIATSQKLAELLAEGTEPLADRRSPRPAPGPPKPRTRARRLGLAALALGCALALYAGNALNAPPKGPRLARAASSAPVVAKLPTAIASEPAAPSPREPSPTTETLPSSSVSNTQAAPAPARAHLSVNALPWAELRVDGHALGSTPKRDLALAPGAHTLELDCPPLGRSARFVLKLAANEQKHVVVDLSRDPPKVAIK